MKASRFGFRPTRHAGRPALPWLLPLCLLAPGFAAAQVWSPEVPVGCPEPPDDPVERRTLASDFFSRGLEADEAGDPAAAMSAYACCFHIAPHPNTLYNLALSAEKAGDVRTAQHALERYISEAPGALNLQEAAALLAAVTRRVGELPPEDAESPRATAAPATAGTPATPETRTAAGAPAAPPAGESPAAAPPTSAPPADDGPSTLAIAGWSLLGGGLAIGVAGGAAFGVLADDEADIVEGSAPGTPWAEVEPHLTRHDDYQTAEIAMIAAGGAVLAAGAVLLILDAVGESSAAEAAIVPVAGDGTVGLALVGWF